MRKFIKGLSLLLSVVMLTGCGVTSTPPAGQDGDDQFVSNTSVGYEEKHELPSVEDEQETWIERPSVYDETETDTTEVPEDLKIPLNAQYLRAGDSRELNDPLILKAAKDLEVYCQTETRMAAYDGFQEVCKRFDETFWENYDLVLIKNEVGSGSIRHEVLTLTEGEDWSDIDWVINVRPLIPEVGSCDMATWTFFVEVPKGVLEADDVIRVDYIRDANQLGTSTTYMRTDGWKPENGDNNWYLGENPRYFMDTKAEFEAYLESHPELSDGFFEFCERYDDEFWQKKDLLLIVQWEGSGSIRHSVGTIFRNRILSDDTWFVNMERRIPLAQTEDEAIWHFFIEIQDGKLDAEDVIAIYDKDVQVENKSLINVQYLFSGNELVVTKEPKVNLIDSQSQLDKYYEANKEKYSISSKNMYYSTTDFGEISEAYHPLFWEQNDLLLIAIEGQVKWLRHDVTEIEWSTESPGSCELTIERRKCSKHQEPAYLHIFLAVPKGSVTDPGQVILNFVDVD